MPEDKLKVIAHLAAHLEEISLAALPPSAESEENSSHTEEGSSDSDSVAEPPTRRRAVHKDGTLETRGESFGQVPDITRRRSPDDAEKGDKSTPLDQEDESMVSRPDLPETHHSRRFLRFVCRDPASVGVQTTVEPVVPLATCADCRDGRKWRWFSGAVNHLHQFHFRQGAPKKGLQAQAYDADEGAQLRLALEDWIDTIDIRGKARETLEAVASMSKSQDRSTAGKLANKEFKSDDAFLPPAFGQEPPAAHGTGGSSITDGNNGIEALNQRHQSSHGQQLERETPLVGASERSRQAHVATGNPNFSCRLCVHRQGADGFKTRGELLRHIRASHSDDGNLLIEETRLLSQDLEQRRMLVPEVPHAIPRAYSINAQNQHPEHKDDNPEQTESNLGFLGISPTQTEQVIASFKKLHSDTETRHGGEIIKDHSLYKNATPGPDGSYHCPWEDQASCDHEPTLYKVNYQPFRCSYEGCDRSLVGNGFPRAWNLRDHLRRVHGDKESGPSQLMDSPREETQARPWKCPDSSCKYHKDGWATEKELSRHVDDKHGSAPPVYQCQFPPCPYKSKRESNCKQHMEKAHGWEYSRTKASGRRDSSRRH
ncbi:conserved hypothetical protein [Verticillium alfalfae VaMs.102]|uniref:C2H2-type domain-containing protein n=1 Tax=Verticillium alfalfae (strain VaMs.102 / ATCC MYA-4576 / FGSC 10136) TaxID=526221 RepID=C9SN09_VERA1|nr:conserved hypothetical protein [Verticillium alfalfae VaMs.102]EEY20174.1 conserved hypothetical protein [Verticillium alfalfae VaMs.102]